MLKKALFTITIIITMVMAPHAVTALAAEFSGTGFSFALPEEYKAETGAETRTGTDTGTDTGTGIKTGTGAETDTETWVDTEAEADRKGKAGINEQADNEDIVLSISSPLATLKVYHQPLKSGVSAATYIDYSNLQLYQGKAGFVVLTNLSTTVRGYPVREIGYTRPLLRRIEDRNYYFEAHLIDVKKNAVITFWGKTAQENYADLKKDIRAAVESFRWEKQEPGKINRTSSGSPGQILTKESAAADSTATELTQSPPAWGWFYPGAAEHADIYAKMLKTEKSLNHKFELLMTYTDFPDESVYPPEAIRRAYADGRRLMLTLQPFTSDLNWIAVPEIIDGQHDRKIQEWAESLAEIGEPIFVRPLNEMNGDWDPWCSWFFGKDNELYILAWRHIVNIFRASGADNVLFVWNPHDRSYPDFKWNNAHLYYPGDAYVDWVGLTGYNNGTSHPADVWREFDAIYQPLYADYLKHYAAKPFMITEFSCNEEGGDKAAWIEKAMASLAKNYPQIKIAVWFNCQDNKWLYQLDSSPAAFEAFQQGLSKYFFREESLSD